MECKVLTMDTWLSPLTIVETARGVRHVDLDDGARQFAREVRKELTRVPGTPECASEIAAYFDGKLRAFSCPLDLVGTEFQKRCWLAVLAAAPYGTTITYAQEAHLVGTTGYQAVGQANRRNPLAILIPCHRVLAQHGPGGYFNGHLELKRALLEFEGCDLTGSWGRS